MPIFGDLMEQESWGTLTLMGVPGDLSVSTLLGGPNILSHNRQGHFSKSIAWGHLSELSQQFEEDSITRRFRRASWARSVRKMAPGPCWFKTDRKEGNHFKKWIWGFSLSCQGSRVPVIFLCPVQFLGHVQCQRCQQLFAPSCGSSSSNGVIFWNPVHGEESHAHAVGCI